MMGRENFSRDNSDSSHFVSSVFHFIPKLPFFEIHLISLLLTIETFCQEELKPDTYTRVLEKRHFLGLRAACFVLCFNKMDQKTSFFSHVNFKLSLGHPDCYLDRDKGLFFYIWEV